MKKSLLAPLAALALAASGCTLLGLPSSPQAASDATVKDEQAALAVETMYAGWRAFVETGVDLGLIRGELAARMAAYDNRIYGYVKIARQAYDAGQTASYQAAVGSARALIAEAMAQSKIVASTSGLVDAWELAMVRAAYAEKGVI
jgi:hypothetical protein